MKNLLLILVATALLSSCKPEEGIDVSPKNTATFDVQTLGATIFAGGEGAASVDGTGRAAKFYQLIKLTSDKNGNLYVLESPKPGNQVFKIRKITSAGVTSTIFNGDEVSSQQRRTYMVFDIATAADGNIYAVASMRNGNFTYRIDNASMYYNEYGTYKLSGDSLTRVSISSAITNKTDASWVAAHNLLSNVAVDANGTVFGSIGIRSVGSVASPPKVFQITPTPTLLPGNTDGLVPTTITGDAAGTVYASTGKAIVKLNSSGISTVFTFPAQKTAFKPKLIGTLSGNLYVYGDVYNAANEFKGIGIYILKPDGTILKRAILNSSVNIVSATITPSGTVYYAVELANGGFIVYKANFD